ncbi:MAG: DUF2252 family protein [Deltaproteobacteria bacterium]|nr:DUF2252 family protein [Deltaproteobacteria bacterium]
MNSRVTWALGLAVVVAGGDASRVLQRIAATIFTSCSLAVALGCAARGTEREEWVRDALVADHLDLLRREPAQVASTWAAMQADPFQFLRGAASLWARDATLPSGAANLSTILEDPSLSRILLVGDPHPENFGTFLPADGALTFDLNDFDAARIGPAHLDLRRLALGFAVALTDIDEELARDAAAAVARGWHAGLDGSARVTPGAAPGHFIAQLFDKAVKKGEERDELLTLTRLGSDGRRSLLREDEPPVSLDAEYALDVPIELREPLQEGLAAWSRAAGAAPVVDVVRVFGAGVGTRPNLRFYALLEDGQIVEAKEARDPFVVHGVVLPVPRYFTDNSRRIVEAERRLQSVANADPLVGSFRVGALSFVVHRESGWQRTLRSRSFREELGALTAEPRDVLELARRCGEVLGAAHARAAPEVVTAQAGIEREALVAETVELLDAYLPTAMQDHARLEALLAKHGPMLGWSP